ncbi:ArnT family glycosyltransferase [Henriciella aquimarina]|uniref:ArnT family glycosyltransferase n=1 Tax=Henriciella aquimarina TaxID=545261 RepID=UPI000A074E5C|nr:glycosyltransferase family 39 protein [Henriciella aquimarina]
MTWIDRLSTGWKAWILLFALTMTAAAPGVFNLPALDRDESRFAQASKQYLETGDYIAIRYQDEFRNKKPAGIHWLQAGSTAAFGEGENLDIWTYRVPSWIGAGLATLACFWVGIGAVGRRSALIGSALFGSSLLLTSEAHISKTDGVLVFLITLAMGCLLRLYLRKDNDRKLAIAFWVIHGAGFLIKGPVITLVAGLAILVLWMWDRRDHDWMRSLAWWPGPLISVLMVLPWLILIQMATHGTYVEGAVGKDLKDKLVSASEGHGGLPGYHLMHLPAWFFPGILLFIPAIVLTWRYLRHRTLESLGDVDRDGLKFLVAWAVTTWIFFELLLTKLSHYILPAYPAFALLCGWAAVKLMENNRAPVSRYLSTALFLLGGVALAAFLSPWVVEALQADKAGDFRTVSEDAVLAQWAGASDYPLFLWWLGAGAVVFAALSMIVRRIGWAVTGGVAAALLLGWQARIFVLPSQTWIQATETGKLALAEVCGIPHTDCGATKGPERVLALGYAEPSYVLSLGTQNLHPPETPLDLPEDDSAYPVVYLVNLEQPGVPDEFARVEASADDLGRCSTRSEPHYALNYSNNDPTAFIAVRYEADCPSE